MEFLDDYCLTTRACPDHQGLTNSSNRPSWINTPVPRLIYPLQKILLERIRGRCLRLCRLTGCQGIRIFTVNPCGAGGPQSLRKWWKSVEDEFNVALIFGPTGTEVNPNLMQLISSTHRCHDSSCHTSMLVCTGCASKWLKKTNCSSLQWAYIETASLSCDSSNDVSEHLSPRSYVAYLNNF